MQNEKNGTKTSSRQLSLLPCSFNCLIASEAVSEVYCYCPAGHHKSAALIIDCRSLRRSYRTAADGKAGPVIVYYGIVIIKAGARVINCTTRNSQGSRRAVHNDGIPTAYTGRFGDAPAAGIGNRKRAAVDPKIIAITV